MPLKEFITDFCLRHPNGVVSFKALVEYSIHGRKEKKESDVHIVKILNQETVYLLDADLNTGEIPGYFSEPNNSFNYFTQSHLNIHGKINEKEYIISIFPLK